MSEGIEWKAVEWKRPLNQRIVVGWNIQGKRMPKATGVNGGVVDYASWLQSASGVNHKIELLLTS